MCAINVVREPFQITLIFLGSMLGTFVLETEYLLYAYIMEPTADFSRSLVSFIKHKDFNNALMYIEYHKEDIKDKTLNSALFQGVFALFSIFVSASNANIFIKALVLSTFLASLYKLSEVYFENKINTWFWALKNKPSKSGVAVYSAVLVLIFVYCLSIF